MLHYTSNNLLDWQYQSHLKLSSDHVIDACVYPLPDGGFRMWYKDEANGSFTYAADSPDLFVWKVKGPELTERAHEGPNVFRYKGYYWMLIDEWRGQAVYRSNDLNKWERNGLILDRPGNREDDGTIGLHADVVVQDEEAFIFYFTHPERRGALDQEGQEGDYRHRRSSVQAARLEVHNGVLYCDRDREFQLLLRPAHDGEF
jgi:hypothetical protein